MFATFPDLFTNVYHFSEGISGVCYLGLGLGFMSATIFGASFADKVYLNVRTLADVPCFAVCLTRYITAH